MCVCNNGNWWYLAYSFSLSPGDNSYLKWRKLEQKLYIVPICMYRSIWGFNITANTLFIWFCFYVGPSVLNLLQIGLDLDTTQIYMYLSSGCSSLTEYAFDFQSSTLAFPYLFVFNFVIFVVVLYWFKTDISGVFVIQPPTNQKKVFPPFMVFKVSQSFPLRDKNFSSQRATTFFHHCQEGTKPDQPAFCKAKVRHYFWSGCLTNRKFAWNWKIPRNQAYACTTADTRNLPIFSRKRRKSRKEIFQIIFCKWK